MLSVPRRVFMHNFNPSPNSSMDMGAPRHLQLNAKDKQHFKLFNFFLLSVLEERTVIRRGNYQQSIPEIQ